MKKTKRVTVSVRLTETEAQALRRHALRTRRSVSRHRPHIRALEALATAIKPEEA